MTSFRRDLAIIIPYNIEYDTNEAFEAAKQACHSIPVVAQGSGWKATRQSIRGVEGPANLDRSYLEDMPPDISSGMPVVQKALGVEMVFRYRHYDGFVCEYLDRMGVIQRYEGYITEFGVKPKPP